ncbi:hypothetical protein NKG05_15980 [Oerskovia sp. M15]
MSAAHGPTKPSAGTTPSGPDLVPATGAYLAGTVDVVATPTVPGASVTQLLLDGEPLDATTVLGVSQLSFNVGGNSIEARYGSTVQVNGHSLALDQDRVSERVTLDVPNEHLVSGKNTVTFAVGTITTSCGVNYDDFDLSDVQLDVTGATVVDDDNPFTLPFGDGNCGSNKNRLLTKDLTFTVDGKPGATTGLRATLDTTTITDGDHELRAIAGKKSTTTHRVIVNNGEPGSPPHPG